MNESEERDIRNRPDGQHMRDEEEKLGEIPTDKNFISVN